MFLTDIYSSKLGSVPKPEQTLEVTPSIANFIFMIDDIVRNFTSIDVHNMSESKLIIKRSNLNYRTIRLTVILLSWKKAESNWR